MKKTRLQKASRSSKSGQFVTPQYAKRHKSTTQTETLVITYRPKKRRR